MGEKLDAINGSKKFSTLNRDAKGAKPKPMPAFRT
jgi:hypothetical protein